MKLTLLEAILTMPDVRFTNHFARIMITRSTHLVFHPIHNWRADVLIRRADDVVRRLDVVIRRKTAIEDDRPPMSETELSKRNAIMPESLPRQENKLLDWSKNLAEKFLSSPSTFGLSESQCEFFAQLQQAFAESYQLAIDPVTRTVVSVADKNSSKQKMILEARKLLNIARATLGDDNGGRASLGIGEKKSSRRRIPCPESAPEVQLSANGPHSILIKLKDKSSERTGKPIDVTGAAVFYHCGEHPPVRVGDWQLYGNQSRTRFTLTIGGVLPIGQMVWVTACWFNARNESGPMSMPRSIRLIGGGELPSYIGKAA